VIARNGDRLGGLFFGQGEPGGFTGREERILMGIAAQAAIAMDNASLIRDARAAEMRFRSLFESVPDAIFVANAGGRYLDTNPAATALLGYTREEFLQRSVMDIAADEQKAVQAFAHLRQEGAWRGERELRRKDGVVVPTEVQATAVALPTETVYLSVVRDISQRRVAERPVVEQREVPQPQVRGPQRERLFCYATGNDLDWYQELGFRAFKLGWGPFGRVGDALDEAIVRAARDAVKVEKAQGLVRLVGDVGRVQSKAGTKAALDGLKLAEGPRDMAKVAELAAKKGGKTRAILKIAGRGAILLTVGTFNLAMWMFWAILTIYGFVASLKRMTERTTERYCARRRLRRARRERERCAAVLEEPMVIYSNAPGVVPAMAAKLDSTYRPAIAPRSWPELNDIRPRGDKPKAEPLESTVLSFRGARKTRVG